jgi:hypothetical protein
MSLVLHSKWLALAQAHEPLVLRNVYVQNQLIPVTQASEVTVQSTAKVPAKFLKAPISAIDDEMRWGIRPKHLRYACWRLDFLLIHTQHSQGHRR